MCVCVGFQVNLCMCESVPCFNCVCLCFLFVRLFVFEYVCVCACVCVGVCV